MLDADMADDLVIHPVVGRILEVQPDELTSHEFPPKKAEAFLAEPIDDGDDGDGREHAEVQHRQPKKPRRVALRDGAHEIAAHVTVGDIQAIDGKQKHDERARQSKRPGAEFRLAERLQQPEEKPPTLFVDRNAQHKDGLERNVGWPSGSGAWLLAGLRRDGRAWLFAVAGASFWANSRLPKTGQGIALLP